MFFYSFLWSTFFLLVSISTSLFLICVFFLSSNILTLNCQCFCYISSLLFFFFASFVSLLHPHFFRPFALCLMVKLLRLMKLSRTWFRPTSILWNAALHFSAKNSDVCCALCKPLATVLKCPRLALLTDKKRRTFVWRWSWFCPRCDKFTWFLNIELGVRVLHRQVFNGIFFESQFIVVVILPFSSLNSFLL